MSVKLGALLGLGRAKLPLFLQSEMSECGLACLAMVASYHGFKTDLGTLRRTHAVSARGATLANLIDIAMRLGLSARPLRLELKAMTHLAVPAILHWDLRHFVVLESIGHNGGRIHDPAAGVRSLTLDEISQHFTGVALELSPTEAFQRKTVIETLQIADLFASLRGGIAATSRILLLSLVLLLFSLTAPLYLQAVVDEVVISHDVDLLLLLAIGFAVVELARATTLAFRSWFVTYFGSSLVFQLGGNLFHHLVRLKLEFFQRRHLGDIVSRFQSINVVRTAVSESLVAAIVDGVLAIVTAAFMLAYAWQLAAVVAGFLVVQTALRVLALGILRERQEAELVAGARESTNFMETIRAIQGIKVFGREAERHAVWLNLYAAKIGAAGRAQALRSSLDALTMLFTGLETIVVVYCGARGIIAGELSTGMLLAFLGYKGQFAVAATRFADKLAEVTLLQLHLGRLADIALSSPEVDLGTVPMPSTLASPTDVPGARLAARSLVFRYGDQDPTVIEGVDLDVDAGGSLAIFGPSGCGKSTLLKILAGLLAPSEGVVALDGADRRTMGLVTFRRQIAAVLHDDHLLSGTIADNIAFFDPECDFERVVRSSETACIHADIAKLPMGYETLIGDLGGTLSAGQQQRILLARALYRQPRILFLDEATSNLDVRLEAMVCEAIRSLAVTRVFVAHRPEAIKSADRFAYMEQGRLRLVSREEMLKLLDGE